MSTIEIEDLTVGYERQPAAHPGSFSIQEGEYVCIVGENGSGKSTFLKTMLGLLKPISGNIVFHGVQKNQIGWLSQQTAVQKDFPASVHEVVLSGFAGRLHHRFFYTEQERRQAQAYMELTGCIDYQKKCFRELSGGQTQRTLLARALCAAKNFLLMDEPMTGLDPQAQASFYELIEKLHQKGMTILMITHDERALKYADQVIWFGDSVQKMTVHEYKKAEHHAE